MNYNIEWLKRGAVKYFVDEVTFNDIFESEQKITGHPSYMELRYVISVYLNAKNIRLSESEQRDVRALRLGGFYSNPRIKYAFVTQDLELKNRLEKSVQDGHTLHATRVFKTFSEAFTWAVT